jgi:hypothetical protein
MRAREIIEGIRPGAERSTALQEDMEDNGWTVERLDGVKFLAYRSDTPWERILFTAEDFTDTFTLDYRQSRIDWYLVNVAAEDIGHMIGDTRDRQSWPLKRAMLDGWAAIPVRGKSVWLERDGVSAEIIGSHVHMLSKSGFQQIFHGRVLADGLADGVKSLAAKERNWKWLEARLDHDHGFNARISGKFTHGNRHIYLSSLDDFSTGRLGSMPVPVDLDALARLALQSGWPPAQKVEIFEDVDLGWDREILEHLEDAGWQRISGDTAGLGNLRMRMGRQPDEFIVGWVVGAKSHTISVRPVHEPHRTAALMIGLLEAIDALKDMGFSESWYELDLAIGDLSLIIKIGRSYLRVYFSAEQTYDTDGYVMDTDQISEHVTVNVQHEKPLGRQGIYADHRDCPTIDCRTTAVALAQEWIEMLTSP